MSSLVVLLNGVPTLREPQNWEALELRFTGWETRLSPDTRLSPTRVYHVKFGSSATKDVCTDRREPRNCGALGPRPLGVGRD